MRMSAASSHRPASRPLRARRRSLPVISSRRSPAGGSSSATRGSKANRCGTPIDHNKEVRRQRGSPLNPLRCRRDQPSGHQLEAVMIIQLLAMAFILAFSAIVILGHVLVVLTVFTPVPAGKSQTADEDRLHQAELPRARIAA